MSNIQKLTNTEIIEELGRSGADWDSTYSNREERQMALVQEALRRILIRNECHYRGYNGPETGEYNGCD